MQISEYGIVIDSIPNGENNAIIKVFTESHGIVTGFSKRVKTKNKPTIFVKGNVLKITYFQREGTMGSITGESYSLYMYSCMHDQKNIKLILAICECLNICFHGAEKIESHDLFTKTIYYLEGIKHGLSFEENIFNLAILIKQILTFCGYSFRLNKCIVTGTENIDDLFFLSPKSASAVCRESGQKYANLMFTLPKSFITDNYLDISQQKELLECLQIIDFFITKNFNKRSHELNWLMQKIIA